MTPSLEVDKNTNVAFLDVEEAAENAKIRMVEVSDKLGLRCQVMARVDIENNLVLGLMIGDYKAFRREIRLKYFAWRVERITELLAYSVKGIISQQDTDRHLLAHI